LSVLGGVTVLFLAIAGSGCGSGSGVSDGATVSVYVSAPLCAGAKRELVRRGAEAGPARVRASCLKDAEGSGGRLDLATAGANARRATEDSSTVAFVETPGPEASFTRPILDEAEIALITSNSGAKAMSRILNALDSRSSDESPREAVWAGGAAPP
jgi:branched-chain amino acid transport system substrate-binding protein